MKTVYTILLLLFCICTQAQENKKPSKSKIVEVACGQCKFGMKGKSCDLAVRIDGKCYFIDGTNIDAHGDAHAKDGFCNSIRKAKIKGKIVNNRFKVESLVLLPKK
jgi:hypothetical protein